MGINCTSFTTVAFRAHRSKKAVLRSLASWFATLNRSVFHGVFENLWLIGDSRNSSRRNYEYRRSPLMTIHSFAG